MEMEYVPNPGYDIYAERKLAIVAFFESWLHGKGHGDRERTDGSAPSTSSAAQPFAKAQTNAERVARTWTDKEVSAARNKRDGVQVTAPGKEPTTHKSTRDAFKAYNLPDAKHIKFRLHLKQSKALPFVHEGVTFQFAIVAGEE